MQPLESFLEWYLGISPAAPGEENAWSFRYDAPWPAWVPEWGVLLLFVASAALITWVYLQDAGHVARFKRTVLLILRFALLGVLLVMLSGLTLQVDRTGLPSVVLLIDDSASMRFEDQYADEAAAGAAERLTAGSGFSNATRLNLMKAVLTNDGGDFLQRLAEDHKLRFYRFSEEIAPLGQEYLAGEDLERLVTQLRDLSPEGRRTRPGPALRQVLDDMRGTNPSAIVIFSDGITTTTDAERLSEAAPTARDRLVALYPVGIGSEEPIRDLHLYEMRADEIAFVDEPILFSAKLKGYELGGRRVTVELKDNASGETLAEREVTVEENGRALSVEVEYTPQEAGEYDYRMEVAPLPEEADVENNAEVRHVSVREEKIRVLLADSYRRWEFWYLKTLLERDPTIEVHTILQDADPEYASQDETARPVNGRFPVRYQDLVKYSVIIFGDLNPGYLSAGILENVQKFVSEGGGGLVMVAGTQHNPRSYDGTPLEPLLPVNPESVRLPTAEELLGEGFQPRVTLEGQQGLPIFRFDDDPQANQRIWSQLPPLRWMVEAAQLKPGAVTLMDRPSSRSGGESLPVIVLQRFGGGKVLFHATDELWLWRYRAGDRYYGRYWIKAIRYLSRSKLLGAEGTAELTTDRLVYQQGDPVVFRLRFVNEKLAPVGSGKVVLLVEPRSGAAQRVELSRSSHDPLLFEGRLNRPGPGSYHAFAVEPVFPTAPPATDFQVDAPFEELQKRRLDRADLTLAAQITRGRFYTVSDVHRLPEEIPAGRPVPLQSGERISIWNRWEMLALFASLLLGEWILRKRCRLV